MNLQRIRFALALPAGVLVLVAFTGFFEGLGKQIYPPSQEMLDAIALLQRGEEGARDALATAMGGMPFGALAVVVIAWTLGAALGAFAACRVGGANCMPLSIAIAVIAVVFVAMNFVLMPHPLWMIAAGVILPPVAAIGAGKFASALVQGQVGRAAIG
ncbi:MAG: hypothetical protein GC172_08810 [Phycisphaera sp.]|nr:hypothetical protein [Phycisphaera sp.]